MQLCRFHARLSIESHMDIGLKTPFTEETIVHSPRKALGDESRNKCEPDFSYDWVDSPVDDFFCFFRVFQFTINDGILSAISPRKKYIF